MRPSWNSGPSISWVTEHILEIPRPLRALESLPARAGTMLTPLVSTRCFEPRGVLYRNILDCERDLSGEIKIARDAEVPREVVWLRVGDEDTRCEEVGGAFRADA